MQRVFQGDQQAFTRLVEGHLTPIHHYALRLSGSRADADDLAQGTFIAARNKANAYRARKGRLSTWLHRITHNLWVDEVRRRRPLPVDAEPVVDGPHAAQEREDRAGAVNAALARLPQNQRCALVLCAQQGMSNAEAARVMGLGVRAVESLLARARKRLKAELADAI